MKRFYQDVTCEEIAHGWQVLLDGKPVKTSGGSEIIIPTQALAEAVREEWDTQTEKVDLASMTFTRLCGGAAEMTAEDRAACRQDIGDYADTDLLCYFAEEEALLRRQQEMWEPLLKQLEVAWDITLHRTQGIMPVKQPEETLACLRAKLDGLSDHQLLALSLLVPALGSLLLALALLEGMINDEEAMTLSMLDEHYQTERWGEDVEAKHSREQKQAEIGSVIRFLRLL